MGSGKMSSLTYTNPTIWTEDRQCSRFINLPGKRRWNLELFSLEYPGKKQIYKLQVKFHEILYVSKL